MSDNSASRYTHGYSSTATGAMASRSANREGAFMAPHLKPGMELLDVGCGPGSITSGFAEIVAPGHTTGLDIEESQIEIARRANEAVDNLQFVVGSAAELPFGDSSFDVVFSNMALEHMPNKIIALREMNRVLRPGGVLGIRSGVASSTTWNKATAIQSKVEQITLDRWRETGGDPDYGLAQSSDIASLGFVDIEITSSTAHFGRDLIRSLIPDEQTKRAWFSRYLDDEEELETAVGDSATALENPLVFRTTIAIETVARKPT